MSAECYVSGRLLVQFQHGKEDRSPLSATNRLSNHIEHKTNAFNDQRTKSHPNDGRQEQQQQHQYQSTATMDARAVQIVQTPQPQTFVLDEDALADILQQDGLKDRFVCVISVAGALRKGKSFLLGFFLRYLYSKYHYHNVRTATTTAGDTFATTATASSSSPDDWLGGDDVPLAGFSWRGGSDRETTGILMWSDMFVHDYPNGEKVAVMLLDTQGTFDDESTVRDCATVFALSTMVSSVQIFNISQNIQEDDLMHLHLFTQYGRLALAESGEKPFQRLQFLIRDWSYPYEAEYGPVGGQKLLNKRLEVRDKQHEDLKSLRRDIASCFDEIACFLMPHPGREVATNPTFDGRLSDIEPEFKQQLRSLVPMLLAPDNLIVKRIGGQKVRVRDMMQFFQSYIAIYQGDELPEPRSIVNATAEATNRTALGAAQRLYLHLMEEVCGGTRPYLNAGHLEAEHMRIREKALSTFSLTRKWGNEAFSAPYLVELEQFVDEQYDNLREHNESKNVFKAARTPTVFIGIAIVMYILSGVFGLFGMYTFANFANLCMGLALLTLATWGYIRYSGEFADFGTQIDSLASLLWINLMKPIYDGCIEKGVQHVAIQATHAAIGTNPNESSKKKAAAKNASHANGKPKSS